MGVLVTGGAGYVGSHSVWELVDSGETVVVLDDLSTGFEQFIPPSAELIIGDVGDRVLLDRILRTRDIESVVHFAGSAVVPDSVADPLAYYLNNTVKSRELIAACVSNGIPRVIFSSTAAVYGNPDTVPIPEAARLEPHSPYGASKMMTERMLTEAADAYGLQHVILRYFNVAGADPHFRTGQSTRGASHLIKVAVEAATGQRDHVAVYGTDYPTADGTGVRDFVHVTDLARTHISAIDHLRARGKNLTLNVGYGRGYSVLEVLEAVQRISGSVIDVRPQARRPGDIPAMVAQAGAIRRELDWSPEFDDLDQMVAHALAWEDLLITVRNARAARVSFGANSH